jgi:hypothetical protein
MIGFVTTTLAGLALASAGSAGFAQDMSAPSFVVGDTWSYRESDLLTKNETGQLNETVTAADAAEYWIDARRQTRTWWLAAAVKREVKHEIRTVLRNGQPFKVEERELVAFKAGGG